MRFIEGFSKITSLMNLTKKSVNFEWSPACEKSFQELKNRLVLAPILTLSSSDGDFVIYSDISLKWLGCVDARRKSDCLRLETSQAYELKYPTHNLELAAIIFALNFCNTISMEFRVDLH